MGAVNANTNHANMETSDNIDIKPMHGTILQEPDNISLMTAGNSEHLGLLMPKTFKAPLEILFEVTTVCNLSCRHCFNMSGTEGAAFNEPVFERLVNEIIDLQPLRCCFSGGEPFIFSDKVFPAALKMRKSGIQTSVITNGWFVTKDTVPKILESFTGVQVSLDGPTKEIHDSIRNTGGSFQRAVNAISLLSGSVRNFRVAHAATSVNYMYLPELASLLVKMGVKNLVIQPAAMSGRMKMNRDLCLVGGMFHEFAGIVAKTRLACAGKLKIDVVEPVMAARRNIIHKDSPNQQMYISAGGNVASNPFIPVPAGNYNEKSLYEIWKEGLEDYYHRKDVREYLFNIL
jgi:MoaA/NifB/PqqE/SkfB family radical SAM enzyme